MKDNAGDTESVKSDVSASVLSDAEAVFLLKVVQFYQTVTGVSKMISLAVTCVPVVLGVGPTRKSVP